MGVYTLHGSRLTGPTFARMQSKGSGEPKNVLILKRSLEYWEGGHTQDIVDVVYSCLSYLLPKHLFVFCMPSISGRQCVVLRLLHGSLGCMASSHRSCWRFVKGHLRKPWLFWQKPRWSAHIIFVLGSGQRTMSTYVLVCGAIALYWEQFAWWSKAVLLFMAFPPSSADLPASLRLRVLYKVPLAFGACGGANFARIRKS